MKIPLVTHIIRITPIENQTHEQLFEQTPPIQRFWMVYTQVNVIANFAKQSPNTLFLAICPEGLISSNKLNETCCTRKQYIWMCQRLHELVKNIPNLLVMPGTITHPVAHPFLKLFLNPAPIFYQGKIYEYIQHRLPDPFSFDQTLFLSPIYRLLMIYPGTYTKFTFHFNGTEFNLFPQICIEHFEDTLSTVPEDELDTENSIQIIMSNSTDTNQQALRAGVVIHVDAYPSSSNYYIRRDSIFEIQMSIDHPGMFSDAAIKKASKLLCLGGGWNKLLHFVPCLGSLSQPQQDKVRKLNYQ